MEEINRKSLILDDMNQIQYYCVRSRYNKSRSRKGINVVKNWECYRLLWYTCRNIQIVERRQSPSMGLKPNVKKSKWLVISKNQNITPNIFKIGHTTIEKVTSYIY